jgi:hypothetical protein
MTTIGDTPITTPPYIVTPITCIPPHYITHPISTHIPTGTPGGFDPLMITHLFLPINTPLYIYLLLMHSAKQQHH